MKSSTVLTLGGLGALAWYLTRARSSVVVTPTGPSGPFGKIPSPSDKDIAGDYSATGRYDWFLSTGSKGDVCDLPDDRHAVIDQKTQDCLREYHAGRAVSFYNQVWLPASRVPITSLTDADFKLAIAFLANKLDRRGMPWTYAQTKAVNDFNGAGFFVALQIASWLGKGDNGDAVRAAFEATVIQIPQQTQGGENHLVIKEAPATGEYDPSDPLAVTSPENQRWNSVSKNGFGPSMDFGFDPIVFDDKGPVYFRSNLFRAADDGTGWELPWICAELGFVSDGGDGSKSTDKAANASIVAKRARLYRTLDVLGAMLKPYYETMIIGAAPDADGNISAANLKTAKVVKAGTYGYQLGVVELWGCVLPAAPIDHAIDLSLRGQAVRTIESGYMAPHLSSATGAESTIASTAPASTVAAASSISAPNAGASAPTAPQPAVVSKAATIAARAPLTRRR